jgi:hypothetical protein
VEKLQATGNQAPMAPSAAPVAPGAVDVWTQTCL